MSSDTPVDTRVAILTDGRPITIDEYLRFGAGIGVIGWVATQIVAWYPGLVGSSIASIVGFWIALTALLYVGGFRLPQGLRYSRPLVVWGLLNALATGINVLAALGGWPDALTAYLGYAFWHPWAAVMAVGYLDTGIVARTRYRPAYLGGALLAAGALTIGLLAPGFITGGTYLVLGAIHAVPMWLDATQ